MKLFIAIFCVFFSSVFVSAHPNPQYRVCTEHGGEFVVAHIPFDQVGLCKVGSSYVGAIDSMNYFYENKMDLSVALYSSGDSSCPNYYRATSLEGDMIELCLYEDGSIMDYLTVILSKYNPANSALNQFLGLVK